jgi:hypothetical protein
LRNELAAQKARHDSEIAQLRSRADELAAVHGELHRQLTQPPERG